MKRRRSTDRALDTELRCPEPLPGLRDRLGQCGGHGGEPMQARCLSRVSNVLDDAGPACVLSRCSSRQDWRLAAVPGYLWYPQHYCVVVGGSAP